MDRERMIQFQIIEQEANQLNSQSELIDQNIKEITELKESLEEIGKEETKEMLVNIGKKIYLPVEIKSKELVVEVGNKSFVNKSVAETIKLIEEQIGKLVIAKGEITHRLGELEGEIERIMSRDDNEEEEGHEHNHECKCGEECECDGECECGDESCNHH